MISIRVSEFSFQVSHFPEENTAKRTEMLSFPFSFFGEIPTGKFVYSQDLFSVKTTTTTATSALIGSEGRNDCQSKNICGQSVRKISFCRKLLAVDTLCHERC